MVHVPSSDPRGARAAARAELDALAKAAGGAMLFGIPLLFTMEMWWIGESMPRPQLLAFVAVAFGACVALARMSGFRDDDRRLRNDASEACTAMAVGVVLATFVLLALGRIDGDTTVAASLGMIAVQTIPLALGAMVANLVFDPGSGRTTSTGDDPVRELLGDVSATTVGALFVGFAVAPTEEIPMLAAGLGLPNQLAVVALALAAGYLIVFASGFDPAHRRAHAGGLFQSPFSETVLAFVVSLVVSAFMLVGFGQVTASDTPAAALVQVLVLAVPASIGGAAGRVVV